MKKNDVKEKENRIAEVKSIRIVDGGKKNSPLRAFATVKILDTVSVQGIKLLEFEKNWTCEFPSVKGKDKDGNDAYYPVLWLDLGTKEDNKEIYEKITEALVETYDKEK